MRPITIALDEAGRLYVGESSGSNERVTEQVKTKPHRILRLEDSDGDGRYDRVSVFVDRVMFPEGTLWLDGALYVAAPPQIWRFRDRDGDGVAEEREVWFDGKTLTGCANDLHGPIWDRMAGCTGAKEPGLSKAMPVRMGVYGKVGQRISFAPRRIVSAPLFRKCRADMSRRS
jgi:hypothetical protein